MDRLRLWSFLRPSTHLELVFPPSTSAPAQIEATVVNMAGALLGLSWSNLGLACAAFAAQKYGVDSSASRAIRAIFLLILGFLAGLARSSLPRLTFASRAAGLVSAFLLTSDRGTHKWVYTNFTELLFVCTVAGAASLVVALIAWIFVPNGGYAKEAVSALGLLKNLVLLATTRTIDSSPTRPSSPDPTVTSKTVAPPPSLEALQRSCLDASLALHSSYAYSAFELRVGRVPISHIKPLLATVGRVREELAWGVVRAGVHAQNVQGLTLAETKPKDLAYSDDQLSKDELQLLSTLDNPSRVCADAVRDNITSLQVAIGISFGIDTSDIVQPKLIEPSKEGTKARILEEGILDLKNMLGSKGRERQSLLDVLDQRAKLIQSREELRVQLDWVVHNMNTAHMLNGASRGLEGSSHSLPTSPVDPHRTSHHHQLFRKSLYATSLLHISSEIIRAMTLIESVLELHMASRPRLFFLRPSWMWLGMSPQALVIEQTNEEPDVDTTPVRVNNGAVADESGQGTGLSAQEVRQGLFQRRSTALLISPAIQANAPVPLHRRLKRGWQNLHNVSVSRRSIYRGLCAIVNFPSVVLDSQWNRSGILHFRIKLSRVVRRIQHSKHARHAVKNALGVTLLAIPSFLPQGSLGRTYFNEKHGVWAIISFMYVLEPNTASTWRVGIMRLCGTFIGATFAFITWVICRENPYGIVTMITAGEIMLTWLVRSSTPGVGVVASVTIPPIIFSPYLGLDYTTVIGLAAIRGMQIAIGIISALLVNHFLFPRHCRVMFLSGMAQVLASLTQLYMHLSHRTLHETARTRSGMLRGAKLDLKLREIIARENVLLKQMEHEISLMPKPTILYRNATEIVQRIADLMSGLRRIRENVPQKEAVTQVLQHRQHIVSCICIVLYTCEHAFRSRLPLPQMLPSPRKAFEALSREVMDALHDAPRATDIAYAVAENEVLEEMIEGLENLIMVTRELFGTNQWLFEGSTHDLGGSFAHGRSGAETPIIQTPRVSMRRLESLQ